MMKLSTGDDATLGSYLKLCKAFFGPDSPSTKFIEEHIADDPDGENGEVIQDESQMMYLFFELEKEAKK